MSPDTLADSVRLQARALTFIYRAAPLATTAHVTLAALVSLSAIAHVWLGKRVVDSLAAGEDASLPVTLAVALVAIRAAINPIRQTLASWLSALSIATAERQIMAAGGRMPDLYRIDRPEYQDEMEHISRGAFRAPDHIAAVETLLLTVLALAGLFLLLATLHPLIPLILLLVLTPHVATSREHSKLAHASMLHRSRDAREMDYCLRTALDPSAAKELRVFNAGDFILHRFRVRLQRSLAELSHLRLRALGITTLFGGLYAAALAGAFSYVAARAGQGHLTIGDVALYLGAVAQAQQRTSALGGWIGKRHEIALYLRAFFRFLDEAGPLIAITPPARALPPPPPTSWEIELRDVRFAYRDHAPVLDGVTALLPAGKVTALVGANGAGKTTLVKLLTRLYDPTSGAILLDGHPLSGYHLAALRGQIAVVYQDFARFAFTLRENVEVALVGAPVAGAPTVDRGESFERALRLSGAGEVAARLPNGAGTLLTRRFDGGIDLSGGEWQKVALARTFIRDASFLILDEPTAALDADAEFQLFQRFRELSRGKTALLISHRFSTVRLADHILVLEDGHIVERGTHDDLLAQSGRYAHLYSLQALRYRQTCGR